MRHDRLAPSRDDDDAPPRCTCTYTAGDAYYCRIHGGDGSWIRLLGQLVEEGEAGPPDPATRRVLRDACGRLPEGHPLRERAAQLVDPPVPDSGPAEAADSLLRHTRSLYRKTCEMKAAAETAVEGLPHARPDYLSDEIARLGGYLEILIERIERIRALHRKTPPGKDAPKT